MEENKCEVQLKEIIYHSEEYNQKAAGNEPV